MTFLTRALLALLLLTSCIAAAGAQIIQIKMVDGKTGRPVKGVCVGLWIEENATPIFTPTDTGGIARVRLTTSISEVAALYDVKLGCGSTGVANPVLKYGDGLRVYSTTFHPSCAFPESSLLARGNNILFPIAEVLQKGAVAANRCGNITASPQPGMITFFVRQRNFHEKVQDWKSSEYFPL